MQISLLNIHEYQLPFFLLKTLKIEKKINPVSVCGDLSLNEFFPIKSLVHS